MPKVGVLIERLLPEGATIDEQGKPTWAQFPFWPPDLFAVAASLVDRSSCYAHPRYAGGEWGSQYQAELQERFNFASDMTYGDLVRKAASEWGLQPERENDRPLVKELETNLYLKLIQDSWKTLVECDEEISPISLRENPPRWCDDAMWLLAVADEASAGLGFFRRNDGLASNSSQYFVEYFALQYSIWDLRLYLDKIKDMSSFYDITEMRNTLLGLVKDISIYDPYITDPVKVRQLLKDEIDLKYLSTSICNRVPRTEVCVQPKTRTSTVGCTTRSLSHHLALLPPVTQVETRWRIAHPASTSAETPHNSNALNLLLVPYPYVINGTCFGMGKRCEGVSPSHSFDDIQNPSRFFSLHQSWLPNSMPHEEVVAKFVGFLEDILKTASKEASKIHGIILPELALSSTLAHSIAERLIHCGLELFISGVLAPGNPNRGPRNCVFTWVYPSNHANGSILPADSKAILRSWEQAKHHRWKIERHQIRRYHLGSQLDPNAEWWEHIDISPRQCYFGAYRDEACLTALVCEDLARIDPVQTVIRSIGPNLVVALLMDGPQLESRWSGRYATVLADDPGCAVLTLTSTGLMSRSKRIAKHSSYQVALWKEAGGDKAIEIELPAQHHAILITLAHRKTTAFTLDGRHDVTKTVNLSLGGVFPILLNKSPSWLQLG